MVHAICERLGLRASPRGFRWDSRTFAVDVQEFDFLLWSNYLNDRASLDDVNDYRAFHIIRDPRDILVSQYYSHRDSHPCADWLSHEREVLRQLCFDEGIRYLICDSPLYRRTLAEIKSWDYSDERILEGRFETLTRRPFEQFKSICRFLEMDIADTDLLKILCENSFERQQARNPGHYRSGGMGQWRLLSPALLDLFNELHGGVVERLGYSTEGPREL
ncbi:MAG: sulfotransferase domain-containing protein [Egibacteraceae bacterium]